jgi:hypothetical protein
MTTDAGNDITTHTALCRRRPRNSALWDNGRNSPCDKILTLSRSNVIIDTKNDVISNDSKSQQHNESTEYSKSSNSDVISQTYSKYVITK